RREEVLARVAPHARGRTRGRAEARLELGLGRPRTVERIERKVRPAVVLYFHHRRSGDARHLTGQPGDEVAVVPAVAAANDRLRGDRVREPDPRLEVVDVVRTVLFDDGLEAVVVGPYIQRGVVAHAEVQRQLRGDRPVVLH